MVQHPGLLPALLDPDTCYPALAARDARFDGHWFVAVRSTGVYCRPVCRVRLPLARNRTFYRHAAAAEAAGYRPCRKCRPELAPRAYSQVEAVRSIADAARAQLDAGWDKGLDALAARLGVSARHLRRVFQQQLGVSPLQYQQTQRLLLAKRLLTDTRLAVADVALRAGFASARTFQHAWRSQYHLTPGSLRRQPVPPTERQPVADVLQLGFRSPYAADTLLRFLAAHAVPTIEQVDPRAARLTRTLRLGPACGQLAIEFGAQTLRVRASPALWPHVAALLACVRQWLDLDADPTAIATHLARAGLTVEPGLRLPGCPDRFELAVRALLDPPISGATARTVATRLVDRWGSDLPEAERLHASAPLRLFPTASVLARAPMSELLCIGLPQARAHALQALAQAWPGLAFAQGTGHPDAAEQALRALPGITPRTASYMILRGWPWPDRFVPGDRVLEKRRAARPDLNVDACAPYRSYAALQLWNTAA